MTLQRAIFCICLPLFFLGCHKKSPLFQLVPSTHSNIHFKNTIVENDSINPIDVTNIYNGAGVGVADFNRDGLQDIFFTGNQVSCKLYLNKGKFKFDDVTGISHVTGNGMWCRGVAVVDINNDGWPDIYVCTTILSDPEKRKNLLYINQGANKEGVPVFKEMAAAYGLDDDSYSTMASFFDYDNDGDLDVYITVNEILQDENPSIYRPKIKDGSFPSTGRLYRNDWSAQLNHPVFTNVTKQAGVTIEGYGHGTSIADFNKDGWKDIFVTNDFISNDLLYINNHDGTFTDKAASYFKHTSANGMGQDVIDINNDGLSDVVELDMDPEDNLRKKVLMGGYNYQNYHNNDLYGYQYQYVRNTLQLNQGPRVLNKDSIGDPIFSDVGYFAGISSTDWSWTPLVQDFDNDGLRDIIVTNGFPKDLTDHDFIAFRQKSFTTTSKKEVLSKMPEVKIDNYAFHNNGDVTFTNLTENWGLAKPSFSNGAAYADLDNDGDLDIIMNNINDEAFIYQNTQMDESNNTVHYLTVKLVGDSLNRNGLGSWVELYYQGKQQAYEQTPYRGYLSTMQIEPHFGLGGVSTIDSLVIKWPDQKKQVFLHVKTNQTLVADHKNANEPYHWEHASIADKSLFEEISDSAGVHYINEETDFIDFNIQRLLPHKLSEYGPGISVGDVNNDSLDDMVLGGSVLNPVTLLLQQKGGSFIQKNLLTGKETKDWEDMGITLIDVDNDGDLDIFTASGGNESKPNSQAYLDKLYINDGHGNFKPDSTALPHNVTSKSCVRAVDFDRDGDLDLFIAGRDFPWNYPKAVSSFIYRNDSRNGVIKFTDVTDSVAPSLVNAGMVCDGLWTDFDNDGWQDLILAGEWMPIKILRNDHGKLKDISDSSTVNNKVGWWNSITSGDFDNDGDIDYVIGNLGKNSYYKASEKYPVSIYANDFYNQGTWQCIVTSFIKDRQNGEIKEFTTHNRDDVVEQLPFIKKKFLNYTDFGHASFDQLFTPEQLKNSIKYSANYFESVFMRNNGNGHFSLEPLPGPAQFSSINGMVTDDFDNDGNLDICINANDFGTDPSSGRYDAQNGMVLKGNGKGKFTPLGILQSGIFIPGNGKALVKIKGGNGNYMLAASQNRGPLKVFRLKSGVTNISLNPSDVSATLHYSNGTVQKRELDNGSSFLSQSGHFLTVSNKVSSIDIRNAKGEIRKIKM